MRLQQDHHGYFCVLKLGLLVLRWALICGCGIIVIVIIFKKWMLAHTSNCKEFEEAWMWIQWVESSVILFWCYPFYFRPENSGRGTKGTIRWALFHQLFIILKQCLIRADMMLILKIQNMEDRSELFTSVSVKNRRCLNLFRPLASWTQCIMLTFHKDINNFIQYSKVFW